MKFIFTAMLFLSAAFTARAQKLITGIITNNGVPLNGITVSVNNILKAVTGANGGYTITAKPTDIITFDDTRAVAARLIKIPVILSAGIAAKINYDVNTRLSELLIAVTGTVTNQGKPVENIDVKINNTLASVTDAHGIYTVYAKPTDIISFEDNSPARKVKVINSAAVNQPVANSGRINYYADRKIAEYVAGGSTAVSPRNFWVDAKVGYNFFQNTDDNFFVGSAKIVLNTFNVKNPKVSFGVIGNIGNFKFNGDPDEKQKVEKLVQSINGLEVGLIIMHQDSVLNTFNERDNISYFRYYATMGGRLSTYTHVGANDSTLNLPQFKLTAGAEYEQTGFFNGGSLTLAAEASLLAFDKSQYNLIFNPAKSRDALVALNLSVILPISKQLGFLTDLTMSPKTHPVLILGIIVKN